VKLPAPKRPSPAMVVALLALVLSTTGVAVAAVKITSTKQLANGVVRSADIKNGTIASKDIGSRTRKALKGNAGPKGDAGAPGAPGSALAYAAVGSDGNVDEAHSKGITDAMVAHPAANGVYCFDLPFAVSNVSATPGSVSGTGSFSNGDAAVAATLVTGGADAYSGCSGEDVLIVTRNGSNASAERSFFLTLN
jgi:hypothetical protein